MISFLSPVLQPILNLVNLSSEHRLSRLIAKKQNEIWKAALSGEDGEISQILGDFTKGFSETTNRTSSGDIENPRRRHKPTKLETAILAEFDVHEDHIEENSVFSFHVQQRVQEIRDQLANTRREGHFLRLAGFGFYSVLWITVQRQHFTDAGYLIDNCRVCLDTTNARLRQTVLHTAIEHEAWDLISKIFVKTSDISPSRYINARDMYLKTPLHYLVDTAFKGSLELSHTPDRHEKIIQTFRLLHENNANIDALDERFLTPLHSFLSLLSAVKSVARGDHGLTVPLAQCFLSAGAEVNTEDIFEGRSILHEACELQEHGLIESIVQKGANLEALDKYGRTPLQTFVKKAGLLHIRIVRLLTPSPITATKSKYRIKPLPVRGKLSSKQRRASRMVSIYLRYHRTGSKNGQYAFTHWSAADKNIYDTLYADKRQNGEKYLAEYEKEAQQFWEAFHQDTSHGSDYGVEQSLDGITTWRTIGSTWRWISFPANNITWISDFISNNARIPTGADVDEETWEFFQNNLKIRETDKNSGRIMIPHARKMIGAYSMEINHDGIDDIDQTAVVSIVIPFLDFDMGKEYGLLWYGDPDNNSIIEEAYSPFTGLNGTQASQTLDQTANTSTESITTLRSKENQVIYRWSARQQYSRTRQLNTAERGRKSDHATSVSWWKLVLREAKGLVSADKASPTVPGDSAGLSERTEDVSDIRNDTRAQGVRQENRPKWLMVRQLWLWTLKDGTVITAIPSRNIHGRADNLLETIQQSDLHEISTANGFVAHIVKETVTFLDKYKWAGLGEHILDIFESEIATEADKEATFFSNFTKDDWQSRYADTAIHEAAHCTWLVKDIRDELRLIRKVLESQLEVVQEFSRIYYPDREDTGVSHLREAFVRDCGLENLLQRIRNMDEEAAATLEGLGNITQAMQAQASLNEAASARLMNFIILPFTVVTVIFTPLSFLTSLFAVNSEEFPHNDEGELRIPSGWLWWRLLVGEFGTLIPLGVLILSIYYLQTRWRK